MSIFVSATEYAARAVLEVPKGHRDQLKHIPAPTASDRIDAERFAQTLLHAQHFVLPDKGRLLDDDLKGLHYAKELRLPYPSISLAWHGDLLTYVDGQDISWVTAAKECTYGDVLRACGLREFTKQPRTRFKLPDNFEDDWPGIWTQTALDVGQGFALVPVGLFALLDRIGAYNDSEPLKILTTTVWSSPATVESVITDAGEEGYDYMLNTAKQAIRSMLELLEALTCRNVHAMPNGIDSPSNVHRARNGKLPIFETKMLTVETVNAHEPASEGVHHIARNGPRAHLRRGHIRRLESGNIWINSMIVAADNGGWIEKGYDVKGA